MKKILASLALIAGMSSAQAVVLTSFTANGNLVDNSFSTASMFSPEIGLTSAQPVVFNLMVEAGDGPLLAFNALVKNLIGYGFEQLSLTLTGTTFGNVGSAAGNFGSSAQVSGGGTSAFVSFDPPEYFQTTVGDWFLDGTGSDWTIDLANLSAGDQFSLAVAAAVPEPGQWGLVLSGLGVMVLMARRRG